MKGANAMKINHTTHFDINIPDALDAIEEDIRKYPEQIGLERADMDLLDSPVFWGHFWKALSEHALDIYEVAMEEGDEDFQFDTRLTLDELEEHNNPMMPPSMFDLNP